MASVVTANDGTPLSSEQVALVTAFSELTMANKRTAQHYLFTLGAGTLDAAVALYFDCGGAPAPADTTDSSSSAAAVIANEQASGGATKNANATEVEAHAVATESEVSDVIDPISADFTCVAPQSQFSFTEGRSACTTIAVEAALTMMGDEDGSAVDATTFEEPSKLLTVLSRGVEEYKKIQSASPVEHMACAEVLLLSERYGEVLEHVLVVQGLTEGRDAFVTELPETLRGALADSAPVCAVITKPPETIVCFVHPSGKIALFDSHPRSTLGIEGAYVSGFSSVKAAAAFLRTIFPAVGDLGDTYMAQMYNSFELTVLRRK